MLFNQLFFCLPKQFSLNKENEGYEIAHQKAFIYQGVHHKDSLNPLLALYKALPSTKQSLMKFVELHEMRYTFVTDLFVNSFIWLVWEAPKHITVEFWQLGSGLSCSSIQTTGNQLTLEQHLRGLQSYYIWNIYKQLTNEMLEKVADLPYNEFERNFKRHIMEPLADTILTKTIYNSKHTNRRSPKQHPKFQLTIGNAQLMQTYIAKQQEDKSFMAPIRTVLVADDTDFHSFLDVQISAEQIYLDRQFVQTVNFFLTSATPYIYSTKLPLFPDVYIRDHIAKYQTLANKQLDFRIYLIPNRGISTLAHYIAMRDDLYCNCVYLPAVQNPLLGMLNKNQEDVVQARYLGQIAAMREGPKFMEEWGRFMVMQDEYVQDYMRDACRIIYYYLPQVF